MKLYLKVKPTGSSTSDDGIFALDIVGGHGVSARYDFEVVVCMYVCARIEARLDGGYRDSNKSLKQRHSPTDLALTSRNLTMLRSHC